SQDQLPVYLGFWTNWSKGQVFGATLTLSTSQGNLLVAFVAFFVAFVGSRLWQILCLILHFAYSTPSPADGLHNQRQAVLRNASSAETAFFSFSQITWAWRGQAMKVYQRMVPILLFTAVYTAMLIVAGGFSSQVAFSDDTSEVLLSGTGCAWLDYTANNNLTLRTSILNPWFLRITSSSATYAEKCYGLGDGQSSALDCAAFIQKQLPTVVSTNASCPFKDNICQSNDSNLVIDTGYLDSNDHFGLNTAPNQRFQYRDVTYCAPLQTEGYVSNFNYSTDNSYTRFYYGPRLNGSSIVRNATENLTYQYSNDIAKAHWIKDGLLNGSFFPYASDFKPISKLSYPEGDVFLFFLSSNGINYADPVTDPWYNATIPLTATELHAAGQVQKAQVYAQGMAASPLACRQQVQFCNPSWNGERKCTPLSGVFEYPDAATSLFPEPEALERFLWTYNRTFNYMPSLNRIVSNLKSQSLTSRNTLDVGSSGALPSNQWQYEVQYWHNTALAAVQNLFILTSSSVLRDANLSPWVQLPVTDVEKAICKNQKIRSTMYSSFSVLGLAIVFVIGVIIIASSWALEPGINCLSKSSNVRQYRLLEWSANSTLQLQRQAHEGSGSGTWLHTAAAVPITKAGELLQALDVTDKTHPRL
ncbi:hypothetical protein GQ53DRAFT_584347, partial [Thozetella sp. PMI_491]